MHTQRPCWKTTGLQSGGCVGVHFMKNVVFTGTVAKSKTFMNIIVKYNMVVPKHATLKEAHKTMVTKTYNS